MRFEENRRSVTRLSELLYVKFFFLRSEYARLTCLIVTPCWPRIYLVGDEHSNKVGGSLPETKAVKRVHPETRGPFGEARVSASSALD